MRNGLKRTISTSGGLGLLQIVSESIIRQCTSNDTGPQGKWIVRSHVDWKGELSISYKSVETSPQ